MVGYNFVNSLSKSPYERDFADILHFCNKTYVILNAK